MDGGAQSGPGHGRFLRQLGHPFGPGLRRGVGEAELGPFGGTARTALEIAGVDERHPHARLGRGRHQNPPHGVAVLVRGPSAVVVDVVELPHCRGPRQRHLAISSPGQVVVVLRRQCQRGPVHLLPPGPKRPATGLGAAPQSSVKGVRVSIRKAGDGQPLKVHRSGRADDAGVHGGYPFPCRRDEHAGLGGGTPQPGVVTEVPCRRAHRQASASSTRARARTPARQSSTVADSAGLWLTPVALRTKSMAAGTWAARMPAS